MRMEKNKSRTLLVASTAANVEGKRERDV